MMLELLCLTLLPLVWGVFIFVRVAVGEPPARGAPVPSRRLRAFAATVRQRRVGIIAGAIAVVGSPLCFYSLARWTGEWDVLIARAEKLGVWWAASAAALVTLSLVTLVVGLWRDPSRGRRRCSNCGYDFASADVATPCPECGRVHRSERELRRTRRSWRVVRVAAALFAASYFALVGQRIVKYGAIGAVPSTLMIPFFEHLPESWVSRYNGRGGELADRVLENELWGWQREWLENRVYQAITSARDVRSVALYAEVSPVGFRFREVPRPEDRTFVELLDDALLHADDPSQRTQAAVVIAVGMADRRHDFEWDAWFASNKERLAEVLGNDGLGAWAFRWLAWENAPPNAEWFARLSHSEPRLSATTQDRYRAHHFLKRIDNLDAWLTSLWRDVPPDARLDCAIVLFETPPSSQFDRTSKAIGRFAKRMLTCDDSRVRELAERALVAREE